MKRIVNNIEAKYNDCFSFLYIFKAVNGWNICGETIVNRMYYSIEIHDLYLTDMNNYCLVFLKNL